MFSVSFGRKSGWKVWSERELVFCRSFMLVKTVFVSAVLPDQDNKEVLVW